MGRKKSPDAAPRTPVKKSLRFEVFKRDKFTCRYCGAQPPDVVLVIDHVLPVAKGGLNEEPNLVTACDCCNQGKGARLLDTVVVPDDADLRYLEIMQEKAELQRSAKAYNELHNLKHEVAEQLQGMAYELADQLCDPPLSNIIQMLTKYDLEIVAEALSIAATAVANGRVNRREMMRYAGGVAKRVSEDRNGS